MYDGLFTLVMRGVNIVFAVALGVLTARLLGPTGKGLYAMPGVQAALVATAFTGLSSATSYFLLNRRPGRHILAPAIISGALLIVVSAIVIVILALIGQAMWAAPAAIASLPASAMSCIVAGYVAGIKRIRWASTLTVATTGGMFALMAVGLLLVARSAWVAIVVWIVSTTIVAAIGLIAVLLHARKLPAGTPVAFREYFGMLLKVGATSLVTLLNYRADVYIVAILLPPFDLGLYTVAVSGAEGLLVPTQIAAQVTAPHIGSLEKTSAARLTARCVRNNLLIACIICALIFALAPMLVHLLYGAAFAPLVPALRILLVGVLVLSLASPISSYYTLKLGKPEIPLVLAGASAAICIASALVLVPRFGIDGAAAASTIAYLIGQGLGIAYFSHRAGVPARALLLPTGEDLRLYRDFAVRVFRDGSALVSPRWRTAGK